MSDLISRSALLRELAFDYAYAAADIVKAATAVDAVPVVRCKDCIHWYEREPVCLKIYSDCDCHYSAWQERKPDDFCSYGERKSNGDNESK